MREVTEVCERRVDDREERSLALLERAAHLIIQDLRNRTEQSIRSGPETGLPRTPDHQRPVAISVETNRESEPRSILAQLRP